MIQFLKTNRLASYILTVLRLYIGWQWLQAGWGKISGGFDASGFLAGAIKQATGEHPAVQPWWADFLSGFVIHNVGLFNVLVPWGEFLVGVGLILGTFTTFAALIGAVMNFSYMFSGTTSINPQMVLIEIFVLIAGLNAAKIGLDRWVIPFLKKQITLEKLKSTLKNTA
ncbi:DoxX family protein [Neobacillus fumarioli]|uniref:DoxX family protein n=1 Tax=Neobacillus fumarioli TaxID=105229 RepID=UPI00082BE0D6|nr:DoxX family protein [Neobacillus fumarioli]